MNGLPVPSFNGNRFRSFLFSWNFLKSAIAILVIADLIMLNFSLTNILGYEYSALNSVLIAFISGLYVIQLLKKNDPDPGSFYLFLRKLSNGLMLMLAVPFLLSLMAAVFIHNCGLPDGVLFYLVITFPSAAVGSSVGLLSFFFLRRFSRTLFVFLFFSILSVALFELYFNVQIYFYNPVFGYYPGTIYDEALSVTPRLAAYRIMNLLFFGILGYMMLRAIVYKKYYSLRYILITAASLILITAGYIYFKSALGFATTEPRLRTELTGHLETRHFSIWFDNHISRNAIENLALYHEYYYREAVRYLNTEPKEKIKSYIFLNAAQKGELLGTSAADFAMIWKKLICVNFDNYDATLKHEIAHCISGDFGATPFRISGNLNMAMVEGLATAADNKYNNHTVHFMAALAFNNKYRYPIEQIFSGLGFFGINSALSYIYSGSFIKYLIDRYGAENFKKVYQGSEFNEVYGRSIGELAKEYYYFIGSLNMAHNMRDQANYYFGRKTIFEKRCARYIAKRTEIAWEAYNRGDYAGAKDMFGELAEHSDAFSPLYGYLNCLRKMDEYSFALAFLENNISRFQSTSFYYPLEMMKGELQAAANDLQKAETTFRNLKEMSPSRDYYCQSLTREKLIANPGYASRFISGSDFDRYIVLRKINSDSVFTASVPALIGLSETVKENYKDFYFFLMNRISVYNQISSYAAVKLAQYAIRNNDFANARILVLTAMNYKEDRDYQEILNEYLKMADWFVYSSDAERYNFKWISY